MWLWNWPKEMGGQLWVSILRIRFVWRCVSEDRKPIDSLVLNQSKAGKRMFLVQDIPVRVLPAREAEDLTQPILHDQQVNSHLPFSAPLRTLILLSTGPHHPPSALRTPHDSRTHALPRKPRNNIRKYERWIFIENSHGYCKGGNLFQGTCESGFKYAAYITNGRTHTVDWYSAYRSSNSRPFPTTKLITPP